jgi:hypothetical protein
MLINSAFRAYHTVASTFGNSMQELRAVGISLYGGVSVKGENCSDDETKRLMY